jgi:broad specificity phosphatase PhoE
MTNLYLIRHGEAISATQNFIGDKGLSPLGVKQAERLRDRLLATKEIVLVYVTLEKLVLLQGCRQETRAPLVT